MKLRVLNREVLIARDPIVMLTGADIAALKKKADGSPRKRVRICAHKTMNDRLHEMFIVTARGSYVRPHKHRGKAESLHVIEGRADAVFFDKAGKVTKIVRMGDFRSGRTMYYRVDTPVYHTLLVRTPYLVFHEATIGPFDRSRTILAPWSPEDHDTDAIRDFLARLEKKVARS